MCNSVLNVIEMLEQVAILLVNDLYRSTRVYTSYVIRHL